MIHLEYISKVNFVKLPLIWIDLCLKLVFGNATAGRNIGCRSVVNCARCSLQLALTVSDAVCSIQNGFLFLFISKWKLQKSSGFWPQRFNYLMVRNCPCYCQFPCTGYVNPLKPELNPICYLLALLAHHFLHVSRITVKLLTLRWLMSYIYIYIYIWSTHSWCF